MFESLLADALNAALGRYCVGIDAERVRVSAWAGDVELHDVQLKATALELLGAPIVVDAGVARSIRVRVPWTNLGKEAVRVEIDGVCALASRRDGREAASAARAAAETRMKDLENERGRKLREGEADWLRARFGMMSKSAVEEKKRGNSWYWRTLTTVLGNLQIKVTNVHVRYEDTITTPGHPFACGMMIGSLSAITVDDEGNPTFTTGGALERISKRAALEDFSWYLDAGTEAKMWKESPNWTPPDMRDAEAWRALFGIGNSPEAQRARELRQYMLHPATIELFYHRKAKREQTEANEPRQKCVLNFEHAHVGMSREQYHSMVRLAEVVNQYRLRLPHAQLRPESEGVNVDPRAWWAYAVSAIVSRKKNVSGMFQWSAIKEAGRKRRMYIAMYVTEGGAYNPDFLQGIEDIERTLDFEVALAWRCIAHNQTKIMDNSGRPASIAQRARKDVLDALQKEESGKAGYLSWMWSSSSKRLRENASGFLEKSSDDWNKLEELIAGGEEEDFDPRELGMEFRGTLNKLTVDLKERTKDGKDERIVIKSTMLGTRITSKSYKNKSTASFSIDGWTCDTEDECVLSSGMGATLRKYALEVQHHSYPLEHELDAKVDVRLAPCYVVMQGKLIAELRYFFNAEEFEKSNLASLEEEAIIQLDAAKESTTAALKVFAVTLDVHAPKVRVPVTRRGRVLFQTMIDFGHFTLCADPRDPTVTYHAKTGAPAYQTVTVVSKDMGVFLAPPDFDWKSTTAAKMREVCETLIAPCDASMKFAIKAAGWTPDAGPRSKAQITMDTFNMYMSPSKLARLYATMAVASTAKESSAALAGGDAGNDVLSIAPKPWFGAPLSGAARAMKVGMLGGLRGYKNRFLCVQGPYLYILEKPDSDRYIDTVRIGYNSRVSVLDAGEGPATPGSPSVQVDDQLFSSVLAIHDAKTPKARAAEANNTWLFRFKDAQEFDRWKNWLTDMNEVSLATRATQPAAVDTGENREVSSAEEEAHSETIVESSLVMELGKISVQLSGQPMGIADVPCQGLEHGGVARALSRNLKDSTEVPIVTFMATNATINTRSTEHSHEYDMEFSTIDIVDELCSSAEKMCLMSTREANGVKIRLNCKILSPNAPEYKNTDSIVRLDTDSVIFSVNRPTVGSLNRLKEELQIIMAAFSATKAEVSRSQSSNLDSLIAGESKRIISQTVLCFRSVIVTSYLERKADEKVLTPLFDCAMEDMKMDMRSRLNVTEISMSFGNLRVGNQFLPENNFYRNVFDLKSSGASNTSQTLINVSMHNHLSSDFPGYEYDIHVKFHNVRVIFLYSFIQRMLGYTSLFLPPAIPVSALPEMERNAELLRRGEPRPFTMKYVVEMKHPEIVFPRSSSSDQAFSMEAESLQITNELEWSGGRSHLDLGAVLLDTTKVSFINCEAFTWERFKRATSMLPRPGGTSFDVLARRPLWDAHSQIPSSEVIVNFLTDTEIELNHAEYHLLNALSCENFSEVVEVPQPLYKTTEIASAELAEGDKMVPPHMLVSLNFDKLRVTTFAATERGHRSKPLAAFELANMHFFYQKKKSEEISMSLICPNLALLDVRAGTSLAAQQAFGSSLGSDTSKTLFRIDFKKTATSYDCNALLQSCRMMYNPQFGLAIYKFFSETEDASDSGLVNARLRQDVYFGTQSRVQLAEDVELCASKRILCNSAEGHVESELCMQGHELVFHVSSDPLIYVGSGRTLRLINARIIIPIGTELCDFVHLEPDSQLLVEESDGIVIVRENRERSQQQSTAEPSSSYDFHMKALMPGLEVVFLDASHGVSDYMLRVRTDAEFKYASEGTDQEGAFAFSDFQVSVSEWANASAIVDSSAVLKPMDIDGSFQAKQEDMEVMLRTTDCDFELDAESIERLLTLSKGFNATLQSTGLYNQTFECSQFVRVGAHDGRASFWRPIPPRGFVLLGDCVTLDGKPPAHPVTVLTDAEGLTKPPLWYDQVCKFEGGNSTTTVWRPVPPDGYYAFGCIVTTGEDLPAVEIMRCIRSEVTRGANFGACFSQVTSCAFLRQVNNGSRTFQAFVDGGTGPSIPLELRTPLLAEPYPLTAPSAHAVKNFDTSNSMDEFGSGRSLSITTTYDCHRVWVDSERAGSRCVSIWRPAPPQGYVSLGDCLVVGPEPPAAGILIVEGNGDAMAHPTGFMLLGTLPASDRSSRAIWEPINPPGYVSCGVVVTTDDSNPPELTKCACIRKDLATEVSRDGTCSDRSQVTFDAIFVEDAIWTSKYARYSLWSSDPDAPLAHLPRWGLFSYANGSFAPSRMHRPRLSVVDYLKAQVDKKKRIDPSISLRMSMSRMSLVLLEQEAYSCPLVCANLSDTMLVVNGTSAHMDGSTMFNIAVSSYNSSHNAWEPVVDSTNAHLKFSFSATGDESAPPGTAVSVKTVSPLDVTISHGFVTSLLRWTKSQAGDAANFSKSSQPRAADEDAIRYENLLVDQDIYLRVGSSEVICLKPGESSEVKTKSKRVPLYTLPSDANLSKSAYSGERAPARANWYMTVKCVSADVSTENEMSQVAVWLEFRFPEENLGSTEVRTRAQMSKLANSSTSVTWNETFHVIPRVSHTSKRDWRDYSEDVLVTLTIVDEHAVGAVKAKLATRSMTLRSLTELLIGSKDALIGEGNVRLPRACGEGAFEVRVGVEIHTIDSKRECAQDDGDSANQAPDISIAFKPNGPWKSIDSQTTNAAQIIHDGKISRCIAKSSGPSACAFKPVATFTNKTIHDVEVCVCPAGMHPDDAPGRLISKKSRRIYEEVYENQRRIPMVGFSSNHLLPTERKAWSNGQGGDSKHSIDEYTCRLLPSGFRWDGQWEVHVGENTDAEGWVYAINLPDLKFPFRAEQRQSPLSMVRMRRWIRKRVPITDTVMSLSMTDDAALRQRVIVKPNESIGLIPAVIGPDAPAEMFLRYLTLQGPSSWCSEMDEDEHRRAWSCMIAHAMEGAEIAFLKDSTGSIRFIGIQVEADEVGAKLGADATGFEDCEMLEDGYYNLRPEAMEWKVSVVAPHVVVNQCPRTMMITVFQGTTGAPLSVKAVSSATITPGGSLPIYSVNPETPYYIRVALDGGYEEMIPANFLLPVSPMSAEALRNTGTLDAALNALAHFDVPFISSESNAGASSTAESITLRSVDGRTAVLNVRNNFGFLSKSARETVFAAPLIIVNKSGVDLVIRTSTVDVSTVEEDDSHAVKVKFLQTSVPTSTRGVQLLREFSLQAAPKDDKITMFEVGVANTAPGSKMYLSPAMDERDIQRGTIIVRATCPDGSLYSLAVQMNQDSEYAQYSSRVILIEPRCTITNQTGSVVLMATSSDQRETSSFTLRPTDTVVPLKMQTANDDGTVRFKLPDCKWSAPINLYGIKTIKDSMKIPIFTSEHLDEFQLLSLHVDVASIGVSKVSLAVENRFQANIMVENTSDVDIIAFRQAGAREDEPWRICPPQSARPFAWSRPQDARQLAIRVLHKGSLEGSFERLYNFDGGDALLEDEVLPGLPVPKIELKTTTKLDIDGGDSVYFNFLPVTRRLRRGMRIIRVKSYGSSTISKVMRASSFAASSQSRMNLHITESNLSLVDSLRSEIINATTRDVGMEYLSDVGAGIKYMKLEIKSLQIDDMHQSSMFPVVVRLLGEMRSMSFLSVKMVQKTSASLGLRAYPFVDVQFTPLDIQFAVHEPLIWRLIDFLKVFEAEESTKDDQRLAVVNAPIQIGNFHVSAISLRLRFRPALYSRPKHALPTFFSGVAFVNIDDGQLQLNPIRVDHVRILEGAFWTMISDSYTRQVARQALVLLAGVDVLDSVSQAFGQASAGVAALSLDSKFSRSIKAELGPDSVKADSIQAGLATGTEMFAKGVYRGLTGVIRKPLEGAQKGGAFGFVKGVGKGLVGAVTQPVAGGLAAVGRAAEGIAVGVEGVKTTLGVNASTPQLRVREPRAQHADGILRSFNHRTAHAQHALRTAQRGKLGVGIEEVLTRKGYYSQDKYFDSMEVAAKSMMVVLTDKRVVALTRVSREDKYFAQWHVSWSELLHVETQAPAHVVLHLKEYSRKKRIFEKRRITRIIPTTPGTDQAQLLADMIQDVMRRRRLVRLEAGDEELVEDEDGLPAFIPCASWKCVVRVGQKGFWAPISPSSSYVAFGHVIGDAEEPPSEPVSVVLRSGGGCIVLSPPARYDLVYRDHSNFTVWWPIAPPQYRPLGAVVVAGVEPPRQDEVICVRSDFLTLTKFDDTVAWIPDVNCNEYMRTSERNHFENASMWSVDNLGKTFVPTRSRDCPKDTFALDVIDAGGNEEDREMLMG